MANPDSRPHTRGEILQLIRIHDGLTARQLAAELGMTSMGVRRHLMALERDGLVRIRIRRQPAGRPTFVFELTPAGYDSFPNCYGRLVVELLAAADDIGQVRALMSRRMENLLAEYGERLRLADLGARVAELARIEDENGYMASAEQVDGGYRLSEANCAIRRVSTVYPEICHLERELFAQLLGATVEQLPKGQGAPSACSFFICESPARGTPRPEKKRARAAARK